MSALTEVAPTLEDCWRAIILFGRNVASYKFALAQCLLELAQLGRTTVSLEELGEPFSRRIGEHLSLAGKPSRHGDG